MIDLHSHVLPGLDDGPESMSGTLAILCAMAADGVRAVAATPHVRDDWPTTPDAMERALGNVRAAADEAGIEIEVLPGGEIALDRLHRISPPDRARFGLGGNPGVLLLEFPYYGWPLSLEHDVALLADAGVTAVIAHPERNSVVQQAPERLAAAVGAGALVQLTAASVDGRLGGRAATCARSLLEGGLAHLIASDAHEASIREAGMRSAVEAVGGALGRWLSEDVPSAIVAGKPIPPRPEVARGRRRLWPR